ncbi:MAG: hypothetical protein E7256_05790 [Lachnospiraceae bacterium]|nr:hypothetical protein [Lachnospiraceae bacterium]
MRYEIQWELIGKELEKFLDFASKISDEFSVARYFNGVIPDEVLKSVHDEYKDMLIQGDRNRRKAFSENMEYRQRICEFTGSVEAAEEYFDQLYQQDMEGLEEGLEEFFIPAEGDRSFETQRPFETEREDFLKSRFTRATLVTSGALFEVCYFRMGKTWNEVRNQLTDLFQYPIKIDETSFENPAFYRDGEAKIMVCSHDEVCTLDLTAQEAEEFKKLGIEFEC